MGRRTIKEIVKRAKTVGRRALLLREWMDTWQKEQDNYGQSILVAAKMESFDQLSILTGRFREASEKKFTALFNCTPLLSIDLPRWFLSWQAEQTSLINQLGMVTMKMDFKGAEDIADKLQRLSADRFKSLDLLLSSVEDRNDI